MDNNNLALGRSLYICFVSQLRASSNLPEEAVQIAQEEWERWEEGLLTRMQWQMVAEAFLCLADASKETSRA